MKLAPRKPRPVTEHGIMARIRLAVNSLSFARVWRNNVGVLPDRRGVPISYGLAIGSADLVGLAVGRFLAIEVKKPGEEPTPDQVTWLREVAELGGIAIVATSPLEALEGLRPFFAGSHYSELGRAIEVARGAHTGAH